MPSTTLQSKISAFESLAEGHKPSSSVPSPYVPRKQKIDSHTPLSLPPPAPVRQPVPTSPSPSPPNLGRRTSLIDLKDWVVDDGPSPTRTNGSRPHRPNGNFNGRTPTQRAFDANHQFTTPLINLESPPRPVPYSIIKAPPLPPRKPSFASLKSVASSSSLISINGPTSPQPTQRSDSLTVDMHTYPPLKVDLNSRSKNISGHAPASSISSFHSVSLSSDTDPSTPGSVSNFIATFPMDQDRDREFSIASNISEADSISLGESYEEVSTSSLASPSTERMITLDWEKAMAKRKPTPPKLPQRPSSTSSPPTSGKSSTKLSPSRPSSTPGSSDYRTSVSSISSSSTVANASATGTRRVPPPPPTSRSSDRSSIQSTTTSHSVSSTSNQSLSNYPTPYSRTLNNVNMKVKRPTPVPPAARKRYECLFNTNFVQWRKREKQKMKEKPALLSPTEARRTRQAAGWRGLSVDLITGNDESSAAPMCTEEDEIDDGLVDSTEQLDGCIIRSIWSRSRLDRERLCEIWNECDPSNTGVLDRDGFVKGMWRIDEELRRAQTQAIKSASTSSLGGRPQYKPPVNRNKPILR